MYLRFYIDQFILEHFLINYLLLSLTVSIQKKSFPGIRKAGGSLLGAVLAALFLYMGQPWLYLLAMTAAGVFTFYQKGCGFPREDVQILLITTVGVGCCLQLLPSSESLPLLAGTVIAGAVFRKGCMWLRYRISEQSIVTVELCWKQRKHRVLALVDSGNRLTEPLTGKPVSILEMNAAKRLLDENWTERKGYFLIPYHSIGTDKGWLQGVTIDRMRILSPGLSQEINRPVIAFYKGYVSAEKRYQMILHPMHTVLGKSNQEEKKV